MANGRLLWGPKLAQWQLGRNTGDAADIQKKMERAIESAMEMQRAEQTGGESNEPLDESRRLRRLQVMMSMVMSVISQDPDLTVEEAAEMAANARRAALGLFPDKELAYDLLYRPQLQRLMNERFRLQ
jgi:hypothetical protein